jgi:hypothetical protein
METIVKPQLFPILLTLATLAGCTGMAPPSADKLARLPVVTYPAQPSGTDYVYKLPAGKAIEMRILVDGNLLAGKVDKTLSASLDRDLYLYKRWASEDGTHWVAAKKLVGVNLAVSLPSWQTPKPGELHLSIDRKVSP